MKPLISVILATVLPLAFACGARAAEFIVMDTLTVGGPAVLSASATVVGALGIGASGLSGGTLVVRSTSATGANPVLDVRNSAGNSAAVILENGNVGIGASPSSKLTVNGDVQFGNEAAACGGGNEGAQRYNPTSKKMEFCNATAWAEIGGGGGGPAKMVAFFNDGTCPAGWTALSAAQGRYLVGLPASGTLGGSVGTALNNLENRSVGQHDHASGTLTAGSGGPDVDWDGEPCCEKLGLTQMWIAAPHDQDLAAAHTHPITGATGLSGAVAGTNAPYYQLLICQKD